MSNTENGFGSGLGERPSSAHPALHGGEADFVAGVNVIEGTNKGLSGEALFMNHVGEVSVSGHCRIPLCFSCTHCTTVQIICQYLFCKLAIFFDFAPDIPAEQQ